MADRRSLLQKEVSRLEIELDSVKGELTWYKNDQSHQVESLYNQASVLISERDALKEEIVSIKYKNAQSNLAQEIMLKQANDQITYLSNKQIEIVKEHLVTLKVWVIAAVFGSVYIIADLIF